MICHSMHLGGKAMDRAKSLVKYIIAIIMFICRVTIAVLGSLLEIFLVLTIYIIDSIISMKSITSITLERND